MTEAPDADALVAFAKTMTIAERTDAILASKRRGNHPCRNGEGSKRLVGWIVDEDLAGMSEGLFVIEEIERRLSATRQAGEPVAWMMPEHVAAYRDGTAKGVAWANSTKTDVYTVPLYAAPPADAGSRK